MNQGEEPGVARIIRERAALAAIRRALDDPVPLFAVHLIREVLRDLDARERAGTGVDSWRA